MGWWIFVPMHRSTLQGLERVLWKEKATKRFRNAKEVALGYLWDDPEGCPGGVPRSVSAPARFALLLVGPVGSDLFLFSSRPMDFMKAEGIGWYFRLSVKLHLFSY